MSQKNLRIFDTTLRDGEQSPGCSMNLSEKLKLARQLEKLGVDVIEAGFPIASAGDFESVSAVAAEGFTRVVAADAGSLPSRYTERGACPGGSRRGRKREAVTSWLIAAILTSTGNFPLPPT